MNQQDGDKAIAKDSAEGGPLAFGKKNQPKEESGVEKNHKSGAQEAPLFTHCTEDKISALFRYKMQLGLRSVQVSFA